MSTHADAIPDEMILAAIDRAVRHRVREGDATKGSIYAHLAIPSRSGAARLRAAPRSGGGRSDPAVQSSWPHRVESTNAGRRRLQRAQRAGTAGLPESPQHRAWRNARTLAGQEIERFRRKLRGRLTHAMQLLEADPPAPSDAFFEMAARLHHECRRLGSATYCLREWAEPDDATADIDDHLEPSERKVAETRQTRLYWTHVGRRNVRLWDTSA